MIIILFTVVIVMRRIYFVLLSSNSRTRVAARENSAQNTGRIARFRSQNPRPRVHSRSESGHIPVLVAVGMEWRVT
jgi:hypothetical protein